jgi:hypothetical protein
VNRPPVFESIANTQVEAGQILELNLSASDPDNDFLVYALTYNLLGSSLTGQTYRWTPSADQTGTHALVFTVSDGKGGAAATTATITVGSSSTPGENPPVTNTNNPPIFNSIANKTIQANTALEITLSATDPDGNALSYTAANKPAGSTLTCQVFHWTPSSNQVGNHQIIFTVNDGNGGNDSETVTITVNAAPTQTPDPPVVTNRAPNLEIFGPQRILGGESIRIELVGADADSDAITYSVTNNPEGGVLAAVPYTHGRRRPTRWANIVLPLRQRTALAILPMLTSLSL